MEKPGGELPSRGSLTVGVPDGGGKVGLIFMGEV